MLHSHNAIDNRSYRPLVFSTQNEDERNAFAAYIENEKKCGRTLTLIDDYAEEYKEYVLLKEPSLLMSGGTPSFHDTDTASSGVWVVIPWRNTAVHCLPHKEFEELRLSRNHDLITKEEQKTLSQISIGLAGLNVGNPAAVCLAQEGIGRRMLMADNDTLSLSNMNRFRASMADLGINKAVLSARQALEINPFLEITVWDEGITPERLQVFVTQSDIIIEEMDNLQLKIAIRKEAKQQRKPVVMVTGNGHDIILDIERYDLDKDLPLLSGKLDQKVIHAISGNPSSFAEKIKLAQDFIGSRYLSERLNFSFTQVGKTLIGIPQLAETTFLRGAVLAHAVRGIFTDANVCSGRYAFGLSDLYRYAQ